MIKEILSPESCAECRGCCFFDSTDIWEMPYITAELAEYIKENYRSAELIKTDGMYKFKVTDSLEGDKLFKCPMLTGTGCVLGDNKPFDCRIYPFRVMRDNNGEEHIAVSDYCRNVYEIPFEKIKDFLLSSGLYEKIIEYKNDNPSIVIENTDGYKIVI